MVDIDKLILFELTAKLDRIGADEVTLE